MKKTKKAVILLSGGLDSATLLARAYNQGYDCHCIFVNYRQKAAALELGCVRKIIKQFPSRLHVISLDMPGLESNPLTAKHEPIPKGRSMATIRKDRAPAVYFPARNFILLSIALSYAESLGAHDIFFGAYREPIMPDGGDDFADGFEVLANHFTCKGRLPNGFKIHTLNALHKYEVVLDAIKLGVHLERTCSCFDPVGNRACGVCDSCVERIDAFKKAELWDTTDYV